MSEGIKHDSNKVRYTLVKPEAHLELVRVLEYGARKYGAFNWEKVDFNRYLDAIYRHLESFRMGVEIDEESGLHTLAHVVANAHIMLQKKLEDEIDAELEEMNNHFNEFKASDAEPKILKGNERF